MPSRVFRSVSLGLLGFCSLVIPGCPGSDDPGADGPGTDSTSSGGGPTTDPGSTTATPTTATPTTATTATTVEDTSGSSSTGSEGDSSSGETTQGASSSGGCSPGTEECACDTEGECDEGLVCDEDLCVVPANCPQEASEPNDVEGDAPLLDELDDFGPNFEEVDGRLPGDDDVDWFSYHCDDNLLGQMEMIYSMDSPTAVRVCQYIDCDIGDAPTVECPEDSEADVSPEGLPGCCSLEPELTVADFECTPDDNDDSGTIFIRVDEPVDDVCVSYDLSYHC